MTISAYSPSGPFVGDGNTGQAFTVSFEFFATSEIVATSRVTATGVEATLVETTDYTVATTGSSPFTGATVTLVGSLAATSTILFTRTTDQVQETDYVEGGEFPAETTEDQLDKLTTMIQELQAQIARVPLVPITDSTPGALPNSVDRAGGFASYDVNGDPTVISSVLPDDTTVSAFMDTVLQAANAPAATTLLNALSLDDTTAFGLTIVNAATALLARGLLGIDTDDDVEFADITATDLITKGPWADVRAYGTLTEGSGADAGEQTANVAAIQAAVDALINGGGTVLIPKGLYLLDAAITLVDKTYNSIHITGMGRATILKTTSTTANIIEVKETLAYPNDIRGIKIDYIMFQGTGSGGPATGGAGVYFQGVHESSITDCWFGTATTDSTFYGIYFDGNTNADTDNNIISRNQFVGITKDALYLIPTGAATDCEENVISNNVITSAQGHGINMDGNKNTITGNTIEECQENGIDVGGDFNTISSNTVGECVQHGINIQDVGGTLESNVVSGNICKDNDVDNSSTYYGINFAGAINCVAVGNICTDNDAGEINLDSSCVDCTLVGNNVYGANHDATIVDAGTRTKMYGNHDGIDYASITAATTTTLPITGNYFNITGATAITSITASWAGRVVTLKFASNPVFTAGSNLKLAGAANFNTSADDCISLVCDGTNWHEISRSANA